MIEIVISRRYAKALVDLAKEKNSLDVYLSNMKQLVDIMQASPSFLNTLNDRFIPMGDRRKVLDLVLQKMGSPDDFANFSRLLLRKSRFGLIYFIARIFEKMVLVLQGRALAQIVSAKELHDKTYGELQKILSVLTKKEVVIEKKIKPQVLGGIAVSIEGEYFDGTIKAHLNNMANEMRKN